ncbi:MAG TPA: transaldolase family protein [Allocoleopsis sp.]
MNLPQTLWRRGQSVWLDNFERGFIVSGQLQQYITEGGLRGVLSNFISLEQVIWGKDYHQDFRAIAHQPEMDVRSLYESIIIRDMHLAADLLKVVHDQTQGYDGFVNLDLSPQVVFDAQATLTEAQRLWQLVGWSNLMLKVPATPTTLSIVEQLICEGINVNVTLLFSQAVYEQVAQAYLRGLETLAAQGSELSKVASVASFSVCRLDKFINALVTARLDTVTDEHERAILESLQGRVAIAQAKLTYQRYRVLYQSDRWRSLAAQGAQPQRLLWDSGGISNSPSDERLFLESLIGTDTAIALSSTTLEEYRKYSPLRASLTENLEAAHRILDSLPQLGISLDAIAERLLTEEVQQSIELFEQLLRTIAQKRQTLF